MSVSAPLPPLQGTPKPPAATPATGKFPDLHSLAVDAHSDLSALAAGLARSGVEPDTTQQIAVMAGRIGDVAKILGSPGAPSIPNPAHQAPAPQPRMPPDPMGRDGSQQQAAPQTPPNHKALGEATAALFHGMAAQAAQKEQQKQQAAQPQPSY